MQQAGLILAFLAAIAWHFLVGAGSCGRTPYGTAETFARAVASEPGKCSERMEEDFPEARGARILCASPMAQALRTAHKTYMLEKSETAASAVCFYGST
jgi:hypothetical protein